MGVKMGLSLSESQTINELAKVFKDFLPGNPHPYADYSISFQGIADEMGLIRFWPSGSKLPAIATLLEYTLDLKRDLFCDMVLEIVKRGMKYRNNKSEPILREEIEFINELILKLKFKIPDLWNEDFLNSLPSEEMEIEECENLEISNEEIKNLEIELLALMETQNHQKRGFEFEKFLNRFFKVFGLQPKGSFKLEGEQIDGSFQLDGQTYLIEAKWQNKPTNNSDLLVLSGKVDGKAKWSRGLFVSYSGFSNDGLNAFMGKGPTNIVCMDGKDIYLILNNSISLDEVIKMKVRVAAETGNIFVSVFELQHNNLL